MNYRCIDISDQAVRPNNAKHDVFTVAAWNIWAVLFFGKEMNISWCSSIDVILPDERVQPVLDRVLRVERLLDLRDLGMVMSDQVTKERRQQLRTDAFVDHVDKRGLGQLLELQHETVAFLNLFTTVRMAVKPRSRGMAFFPFFAPVSSSRPSSRSPTLPCQRKNPVTNSSMTPWSNFRMSTSTAPAFPLPAMSARLVANTPSKIL